MVSNLRHERCRLQRLGFQCLYVFGMGIRTQHNDRHALPLPGTGAERILFYIDFVKDLAKSTSDPRVSRI